MTSTDDSLFEVRLAGTGSLLGTYRFGRSPEIGNYISLDVPNSAYYVTGKPNRIRFAQGTADELTKLPTMEDLQPCLAVVLIPPHLVLQIIEEIIPGNAITA